MSFKLPEDLSKVTPEDLDKLHDEALAAGNEIDLDDPELSDEDLQAVEDANAAVEAIRAERETRSAAEAERTQRVEAAKAQREAAKEKPAEEPAAEATEQEPAEEPAAETPVEEPLDVEIPNDASELVGEQEEEPAMAASGKQSVVARAAGRIEEPEAPKQEAPKRFSLIASGDVRGFSAGQEMTFSDLTSAFGAKLNGFQEGRGKVSRTDKYALAEMHLEAPAETTIFANDSGEVAGNKLRAAVEKFYGERSPFARTAETEALVAAAGDWGAPSQIIYDIPQVEQAPDGLLSLPSVTVERGGFQHTLGIDFSVITGDSNFGFTQTEAQAAAKTVKPFISPTNPTFQDERLKVIGYGMEAGILTIKGYPELIKRYTSGTATAFAHYRNKDAITRLLSYFPADGSAIAVPTIGSIVQDTLDTLSFYAQRTRYKYSLQNKQTFELVMPMWALDVFREDLAKRQGWDAINVPDSYIEGLFTQRKFSVQWIKDWTAQDLAGTDTGYHTTAQVLMYLPGTFVRGGGPVVSYDAVVDYDHISTNTIVQLFREESVLVAQMLNVAPLKFTIPTGTATVRRGRVGSDDYGKTVTGTTYA